MRDAAFFFSPDRMLRLGARRGGIQSARREIAGTSDEKRLLCAGARIGGFALDHQGPRNCVGRARAPGDLGVRAKMRRKSPRLPPRIGCCAWACEAPVSLRQTMGADSFFDFARDPVGLDGSAKLLFWSPPRGGGAVVRAEQWPRFPPRIGGIV